jgi:hypothetical protein
VLPDQLLSARRDADFGNSLWLTYNVVQENLVTGGLQGRSASGRTSRTRAIRAIREDIRINVGLWNHAMGLLEGCAGYRQRRGEGSCAAAASKGAQAVICE